MELDKGQRRGGPAQITHRTRIEPNSEERLIILTMWRTKEADELGLKQEAAFC